MIVYQLSEHDIKSENSIESVSDLNLEIARTAKLAKHTKSLPTEYTCSYFHHSLFTYCFAISSYEPAQDIAILLAPRRSAEKQWLRCRNLGIVHKLIMDFWSLFILHRDI